MNPINRQFTFFVLTVTAFTAAQVPAQQSTSSQSLSASWGLFVYPSAEQKPEQQKQDEYECYEWGKQTTGIDPLAPQQSQPQQQPQQQGADGSAAKGALRGAAKGALIGEIVDDDHTGDYAAYGAAAGAMRGRRAKKRQTQATQQQAQAQAQTATEQSLGNFKKAFSACLEGRRYTVK